MDYWCCCIGDVVGVVVGLLVMLLGIVLLLLVSDGITSLASVKEMKLFDHYRTQPSVYLSPSFCQKKTEGSSKKLDGDERSV